MCVRRVLHSRRTHSFSFRNRRFMNGACLIQGEYMSWNSVTTYICSVHTYFKTTNSAEIPWHSVKRTYVRWTWCILNSRQIYSADIPWHIPSKALVKERCFAYAGMARDTRAPRDKPTTAQQCACGVDTRTTLETTMPRSGDRHDTLAGGIHATLQFFLKYFFCLLLEVFLGSIFFLFLFPLTLLRKKDPWMKSKRSRCTTTKVVLIFTTVRT